MRKKDWDFESEEIFKRLLSKFPDTLHSTIIPITTEAAEKRCVNRQSSSVNLSDLILGIFDVVPEAFKSKVVEELESFGINVEGYLNIKKYRDRVSISWERFAKGFRPGVIHFAMYLTDKCNMKCIHCATDRKPRDELSVTQWCKIIENLESSLQEQGRRGTYIWFGGEPTLRKDIEKIMKYCYEKDYNHAIITNGIKFTEDFAKMCKKYDMSHVFVSFDSANPEKNDYIRGFKNSLSYAEKAIKNSIKYGLFVCASITVMKQNINELNELKALAESWGAVPFFRPVVKQKGSRADEYWGEIGLSVEQYKQLYQFKYDRAINSIKHGKAGTLPVFEIYEMTPFMEVPQNEKELAAIDWGVGCQACKAMMGIEVDGTIYPTGYPTKTTLGNALKDDFRKVLDSQLYKDIRDRKRNGKCGDCPHLELCGGGCRVLTEALTGDILGSFPYCWYENDK
ncbi:MAG: radical SAM protein [Candidatus Lokiarchaeota archaeon]|nr:radical SAM protein [Candidatus Lokiarchaeota archaeon]MBD3201121.1 radical SAM protein [Candidatus Lokiarchaeota archaeon]